jgi:transglutaminase-like putative cysteine protease
LRLGKITATVTRIGILTCRFGIMSVSCPRCSPPRHRLKRRNCWVVFLVAFATCVANNDSVCAQSAAPASEADEKILIAPPPPWVQIQKLDVDSPHPSAVDAGMYLRLRDQQLNLANHSRYSRYADEFVNTAGVQDQSEILIEFDPAYQALTVHEVVIHRDGKKIDVLTKGHDLLRLHSTENEFEDGILNGHHLLMFPVPGVKVGDILDYSYSIKGRSEFFGQNFTDQILLERAEPIHHLHYRLLKPSQLSLHWKNHRTGLQPTKHASPLGDELEELVWQQHNIAAVFVEADTPTWYQPYAFVQLSSFPSWTEVARHGRAFYDFSQEPLPTDLAKRIEQIAAAHNTPEDRARVAARLVQDEIRYLAITDGEAAYCPDRPSLTWQRQFGDCKNKTTLLMRILTELEIDSTPVYVDLDATSRGFDWLPTPSGLAFDHVILRIDLSEEKTVWVDSTVSQQGRPLSATDSGNFFLGLPLEENATDLVRLPARVVKDSLPEQHLTETFRLGDIGETTDLTVAITYRGNSADDKRHYFSSHHPTLSRRSHARSYRNNFPDLTVTEDPQIEDDLTDNRLKFTANYSLGDAWSEDPSGDGYHSVFLYFDSLRNALRKPINRERQMPFDLGPPRHLKHTTLVHLPAGEDWEFDDEDHFVEEAGVRFERSVRQMDKTLTIELTLSNAEDHVAVADIPDYQRAAEDIMTLCHYSIWRLSEEAQHAMTAEQSASATQPEASHSGIGIDTQRWLKIGIPIIVGVFLFLFVRRLSGSRSV